MQINFGLPKAVFKSSAAIANHLYACPAGAWWEMCSLQVTYVSSATVGNRNLEVQILDQAGNIVARYVAGVTQAASLTRKYTFLAFGPHQTAFYDTDTIQGILPALYMGAGWTVKVIDNKAIDAADTAISALVVREAVQ